MTNLDLEEVAQEERARSVTTSWDKLGSLNLGVWVVITLAQGTLVLLWFLGR